MSGTPERELEVLIEAIPEGWSRVLIDGQPWAMTRTTRADGRVISVDAELLGTSESLGANVWATSSGTVLRPCEVPEEKVMNFLRAAAAALTT